MLKVNLFTFCPVFLFLLLRFLKINANKTIKKDIFFKESPNLINNDISIDNFRIFFIFPNKNYISHLVCHSHERTAPKHETSAAQRVSVVLPVFCRSRKYARWN